MITISAFHWVPDLARGQVRDLRVRWALEEAGLPYQARLLEQGDQDKDDYRALQPFGQVPIFEEDGFTLFESGAIVLHIGERSTALLPEDPKARARATQWVVAALSHLQAIAHQSTHLMTASPVRRPAAWKASAVPAKDASPGTGRGVCLFIRHCGGWGGTR